MTKKILTIDALEKKLAVLRKEGKRIVVRLAKPDSNGTPPPQDLIVEYSFTEQPCRIF